MGLFLTIFLILYLLYLVKMISYVNKCLNTYFIHFEKPISNLELKYKPFEHVQEKLNKLEIFFGVAILFPIRAIASFIMIFTLCTIYKIVLLGYDIKKNPNI